MSEPEWATDAGGNVIEPKPRLRAVRDDEGPPDEPDLRPIIRTSSPLAEQGDAGLDALCGEPNLYQQSGYLARVVRVDPSEATPQRPDGSPEIRRAETETIRELLSRHADFERFDKSEKQWVATHPPKDVAAAIRKRGEYPGIRPLDAIIESPTLRPDGSLLDRPGYDAATRVLLLPGVDFPKIRDEPLIEHAHKALAALCEPFKEFPWTRPEGMYVPIAAILTLAARTAIQGSIPAIVFDSSVAGAGKTLLSGTVTASYTGRWAEGNTFPDDPVEMEKSLGGEAMSGAAIVDFDNVEGLVESPPLLKVLTARDRTRLRVMGSNTKISVRWRALIILGGVNIVLGRQMSRRSIVARLEPAQERPEEREGFALDLPRWAPANRTRLCAAALTLLRAYVVAGRPDPGVRLLGSFEEWTALVARAIVWAGGLDVTRCRPSTSQGGDDPETEALRVVLPRWQALTRAHGVEREGMTCGELLKVLYPGGRRPGRDEPPDGYDELRDALEALASPKRSGGSSIPTAASLGYRLRAIKGRWIASKSFINRAPTDGNRAATWAVVDAG